MSGDDAVFEVSASACVTRSPEQAIAHAPHVTMRFICWPALEPIVVRLLKFIFKASPHTLTVDFMITAGLLTHTMIVDSFASQSN